MTVISDAGRSGEPRLEIYSAAKAGAAGFMRSAAKSTARHGIRANCVSLSATVTPSSPSSVRDTDSDAVKASLSRYLIRRFGTPEDASNMILFLASDASSWVTGQTFP